MIYLLKQLEYSIQKIISSSFHQQKAVELRTRYQENKNHKGLYDTYLMSRMPATYAAISRVLSDLPLDSNIKTVLDIGSGPGTGLWAVLAHFKALESYTGLEGDRQFIELAKVLSEELKNLEINWKQGVYPKDLPDMAADLVLMSYTLGENTQETLEKTLESVWKRNVSEWLVVVEPGTPKGFNTILQTRAYITTKGGYIYTPCKGNYNCPLSEKDWCHFSVRLARSSFQKKVKGATLPYEDEKFSYLVARKSPVIFDERKARIIKKPVVRSGHITLDLCDGSGYERMTVSKSQKEVYQKAKKSEWGDDWERDK